MRRSSQRGRVESYDYSYAFSEELQQQWRWSERYATQPEILRYIHHVADRFDLRRDVHLGQRMTQAEWDDATCRWSVVTEAGEHWSAPFLVMATGQLSTTKSPGLPGEEIFTGELHHTARWPHEQAAHLTVFQRTPNFSVPAANAPITDGQDAEVKANYSARREAARDSLTGLAVPVNKQSALEMTPEARTAHYEHTWPRVGLGFAVTYYDILRDQAANDTAADFIRGKIQGLVKDLVTREQLTPRDFPFAAKRPSVDSGNYETFNRDNVTLADIRSAPIEAITATGIRTSAGEYDLDMIVFAIGFDALTGSLLRPEIVGRDGVTLKQTWAAGPSTYLGLMVAGFPNLFIIAGPGSPSLLSNALLSTEQHVDWISALLAHLSAEGRMVVQATLDAERRWVEHVNERAQETLYPLATSYYNGDEVPGKPRVCMPYVGGVRGYRRILEKVVTDGYEGFSMRARETGWPIGRPRQPAEGTSEVMVRPTSMANVWPVA